MLVSGRIDCTMLNSVFDTRVEGCGFSRGIEGWAWEEVLLEE
jgi:hypothetical protein